MLILSTGSLHRYGLNRIFEFAKEGGFDGICLVINEVFDTRDPNYIKKLSEHFALPVTAVTVHNLNTQKKVEFALEIAEKLGSTHVILRPPLFVDVQFSNWFKTEVPKLQKENSKIKIAVENPPGSKKIFIPEYSFQNIDSLKRFQYISLDTSNIAVQQLPLIRVYKMVRKRLTFIHLSNFNKGESHQLLGEGEVPVESFLTNLKKDEYTEPICVKFSLEAIGAGDNATVLKNLKETRETYEKYYVNK